MKSNTILICILFLSALLIQMPVNAVGLGKKKQKTLIEMKSYCKKHLLQKYTKKQIQDSKNIYRKLDSCIYKKWNSNSNLWENLFKEQYVYANNGNVQEFIELGWNGSINSWANENKVNYIFNSISELETAIEYNWDVSGNSWVNFYKEEYTYNNEGNLAEIISSIYDNNSWIEEFKNTYTYENEKISTIIDSYWDGDAWVEDFKYEYVYDAEGMLESIVEYLWDYEFWLESSKEDYSYYSNGKIVMTISYHYTGIDWIEEEESVYVYDEEGNPETENYYNWNSSISQWEASSMYEYEYNYDFEIAELIYPFLECFVPDFGEYIENMPIEYISYSYINNNWVEDEKGTYFYSEELNVKEISEMSVNLYPNPASDCINIELEDNRDNMWMEMYNINGEKVLSEDISNHQKIYVGDFKRGVYFITLKADRFNENVKIILN